MSADDFIPTIRDAFGEGDSLADLDEWIGPFDALELAAIRDQLADLLTPEEQEWIPEQIRLRVLADIERASTTALARQEAFDVADAQMLSLCDTAAALGYDYTLIGRKAGASRQVITKRIRRYRERTCPTA